MIDTFHPKNGRCGDLIQTQWKTQIIVLRINNLCDIWIMLACNRRLSVINREAFTMSSCTLWFCLLVNFEISVETFKQWLHCTVYRFQVFIKHRNLRMGDEWKENPTWSVLLRSCSNWGLQNSFSALKCEELCWRDKHLHLFYLLFLHSWLQISLPFVSQLNICIYQQWTCRGQSSASLVLASTLSDSVSMWNIKQMISSGSITDKHFIKKDPHFIKPKSFQISNKKQ